VKVLTQRLKSFDFDVNVSLFETTIRLLGGLLSAHLFAIDPILNIYHPSQTNDQYNDELLKLAIDLGNRLYPAFLTKTGIPYGTVNLRNGVPKGETKIASTAGAGTLLMEFEVLSYLTGDEKYGKAAYTALEGIYNRRSDLDLVGKHINTETGQWQETLSGVGSNSDSFYEYLFKSYSFTRNLNLYHMFSRTYRAVKQLILIGDEWFSEVDMYSGKLQRRRVENLDAFWPGMESLLGNTPSAALQLNALYSIWMDLGFLPEELDQVTWESNKGATNPHYALRPELVESTYYQYQTTKDRSWLLAGKIFLESLEKYTKTGCGYAAINDVSTLELHDSMPSFFLSETCKYMYLLFDEDNFLHQRPYVFSTEAHPYDLVQLFSLKHERSNSPASTQNEAPTSIFSQLFLETRRKQRKKKLASIVANNLDGSRPNSLYEHVPRESLLPLKCGIQTYSTTIQSSFLKDEMLSISKEPLGDKKHRKKSILLTSKLYLKEKIHSKKNILRGENLLKSLKTLSTILDYREKMNQQIFGMDSSSIISSDNDEDSVTPEKCKSRHPPTTFAGSEDANSLVTVEDGDSSSSSTMPADSTILPEPDDIPPLKSLDLSLGSLGQFNIKVYADGFRIVNKQDHRTLEVTNVGKKSIFLRESDTSSVRSVIGKATGNIQTCFVEAKIPYTSTVTHSNYWRK
jgi:hypothetical protein